MVGGLAALYLKRPRSIPTPSIPTSINTPTTTVEANAATGSHRGQRTHNQDHATTPQSFKAMNKIANAPKKVNLIKFSKG
jgi:hypothetical protein